MVLQIAVHGVFSCLIRGLEHFADSSSIPWNPPTIFHPSLISTVMQKFLLSAIPFLSDLCGVEVQGFQENSFTSIAKFQGIVSVNDFWFPGRLQELFLALLCFLRSCLFTWVRLYPLRYPLSCVAKSCTTTACR